VQVAQINLLRTLYITTVLYSSCQRVALKTL
jgi:hypothetical protein